MPDTLPPIVKKRSDLRSNTATTNTPQKSNPSTENRYTAKTQAVVSAARDKANSVVHSAREWLTPSSEWTSFPHLDSLSTVMFSPLAAHPVYRSESMVKALQLMQQQQARQNTNATPSSNMISTSRTDLVLHGKMYAWPSSTVLLEADIPESSSVSLFQGFASAYPSLAKSTKTLPRKVKQRRKKSNNPNRKGLNLLLLIVDYFIFDTFLFIYYRITKVTHTNYI